jgi:hypothetical protein
MTREERASLYQTMGVLKISLMIVDFPCKIKDGYPHQIAYTAAAQNLALPQPKQVFQTAYMIQKN